MVKVGWLPSVPTDRRRCKAPCVERTVLWIAAGNVSEARLDVAAIARSRL
jgi:hypothetical protein